MDHGPNEVRSLILVVAVLMLLMLIGVAYLSSTQTEQYTARQHTDNTQADLILQGTVEALKNVIARGVSGPTPDGPQYRPGLQEMVVSPAVPVIADGAYNPYTSWQTDLWLAARVPNNTDGRGTVAPLWSSLSWPLSRDPSGGYSFDSPFEGSIHTYGGSNKKTIVGTPTFKLVNGVVCPAMFLHTAGNFATPTGSLPTAGFLNPSGSPTVTPYAMLAADADGDGIADSMLVKVAEHDGITYYVAVRVIDGNSAINVSSAWTREKDLRAPMTGGVADRNFGFFRSNVGLLELLGPSGTTEMPGLNSVRLNNIETISPPVPSSTTATAPPVPGYPANYNWWSAGDAMEHLLIARPGNPYYGTSSWLGIAETMRMASRFCLYDSQLPPTNVERYLAVETTSGYRSTPYAPSETGPWFNLFNYPDYHIPFAGSTPYQLRPLLVGHNAVSNAVPSRYGFTLGSGTDWRLGSFYHTGDWVKGSNGRSYVCLVDHPTVPAVPGIDPATQPGVIGYDIARRYWAALPTVQGAGDAPRTMGYGMPWTGVPTKISINTAPFEAMLIGFWNMMADTPAIKAMATVPPTPYQPARPPMNPAGMTADGTIQMPQFRNVIRTTGTRLSAAQMLKLRAALAAVQAENLRSGNDDVIGHRITLDADISETTPSPAYDVEVFGTKRQPFITEVVAQTDTNDSSKRYFAMELSNPYPVAIDLSKWVICTIDRAAVGGLTLTPQVPTSGMPIIPAATPTGPGVIVFASSLMPPPGIVPPTAPVVITNFEQATGKEIVLMRPRRADGNLSKSTDPNDPFTEDNLTSPSDMVPADQLDTTGMDRVADSRFHYRRASARNSVPGGTPTWDWNLVYPGDYDLTGAEFSQSLRSPIIIESDPDPTKRTGGNLGIADVGSTGAFSQTTYAGPAVDTQSSTFNTVPLQLALANAAGGNPVQPINNMFPFGTFARNADMLQIPFIGSYRIVTHNETPTAQPGTFVEMNSVTMDAALARDTTLDQVDKNLVLKWYTAGGPPVFMEQIGRFCPVGNPGAVSGNPPTADDTQQMDFSENTVFWHYHWAKRLFDYFTVQSPQDDYDPNYNPAVVNPYISATGVPSLTPGTPVYPGGSEPQPVANTSATTGGSLSAPVANTKTDRFSEDTAGLEGQININTAPYPVLAMLPFNANKDIANSTQTAAFTNEFLAQAIVDYRTTHGPFRTIFDLYNVPQFRQANDAMLTPPAGATTHYDPGPATGDFSPGGMGVSDFPIGFGTDNVAYDFKERFLLMNHISNLVTTRSDTFTAYVLVQGYRGVDTGNPVKVEERRAAFLIDRNNVTPANSKPVVTRVPQ